jgi:hypothetical protein
MPFTTVRDLRMHYEIRGSGPRVLFISGTGGDLRRSPNAFDWPLTKHFEVLARTISADLADRSTRYSVHDGRLCRRC